ncbi:MAG: diphthamide biosynthesis enzyme Dph2 [Thermoplasmata archaeon]|nr:diphthamide biosynthesis enzyme Dph2 [Thermoplasmata archaeon]
MTTDEVTSDVTADLAHLIERAEERSPGAVGRVFATVGPELFAALRGSGFRRVALQVPAGLTRGARELADRVRTEGRVDVVLVARACFGACDFPSPDEVPGVDAAIVLGHSPIPNVRLALPTFFVEMRHPGGDPAALAEVMAAAQLPSPLGLVASVQHMDLVGPLQAAARARSIELTTGEGDRRLAYPVQALGCNYTSAEQIAHRVLGFLFLGTGEFHPRGLALAVDRPVWSLDPLTQQLAPPIDRATLLRERLLLIAQCQDARKWGVLVSTFAGQNRSPTALALIRKARARGLDAEALVFGRLDPADLLGRDFDAYVNTACPRIALDDSSLYPRPVLTPPEFLQAIGERPLSEYRFDTYH